MKESAEERLLTVLSLGRLGRERPSPAVLALVLRLGLLALALPSVTLSRQSPSFREYACSNHDKSLMLCSLQIVA